MLNKTIIFLLKNAVNNRDVVEQNIGKNAIKGLSNILHASANVPDNQVNLGWTFKAKWERDSGTLLQNPQITPPLEVQIINKLAVFAFIQLIKFLFYIMD